MNIAVYCGASLGKDTKYKELAAEVGKWIADSGHTLVYGGGKIGLMGVVADAVLERGGKVIGVIPEFLSTKEQRHDGVTEMITTKTMSERKNKMLDLSQAYIALPGGTGTLEEIVEAVSLLMLNMSNGPCIFMNQDGYYDLLNDMLEKMICEEFLPRECKEKIVFAAGLKDVKAVIDE